MTGDWRRKPPMSANSRNRMLLCSLAFLYDREHAHYRNMLLSRFFPWKSGKTVCRPGHCPSAHELLLAHHLHLSRGPLTRTSPLPTPSSVAWDPTISQAEVCLYFICSSLFTLPLTEGETEMGGREKREPMSALPLKNETRKQDLAAE